MKKRRSTLHRLLLTAVALATIWAYRHRDEWLRPTPGPAPDAAWRTVVRVVDGDTLLLDGKERVRLIGVDAPETHHPSRGVEPCGYEASDYVQTTALGQRVRLEYDWERFDHTPQQRTLAYVYLEDGKLLNALIIHRGYAHAYRKFKYRMKEAFLMLDEDAHRKTIGCLPLRAPQMPRE